MRLNDTIHRDLPKKLFILFLFLILLFSASKSINSDLGELFHSTDSLITFLNQFLDVEWSYSKELIRPMISTIAMSVAGTFLGALLAIPAGFAGTYLVTENRVVTQLFRLIFGIVRTIPNLLLAAIFVAIVGIGEFTGVLTIAIFTFGMLSQLIFTQIETIEEGPLEANTSVGATRLQNAMTAVWPQVDTSIYRYILYAFEVNVRASAVLGYVGAGGIGVLLNTALGFRQYGRVSLIILFVLIVVTTIDLVSQYLREEVIS